MDKREIAIFKSADTCEMIGDESWTTFNNGEYIRITEYVVVEFPPRNQSEIVPEQVAALESAKDKLKEAYLTKTAELDERISRLLAITHQETNNE